MKNYLTDLEIQNNHKLKNIKKILKKLNITDYSLYGSYIAKVSSKDNYQKKGKLVLVSSINPTPFGEGKTTMSIGIADALNILLKKENKQAILALREPSLGPVFGLKGGATGGGYAQVCPMVDINLHFTGDFHAITSANNLLCAMIDNHIFQGNLLNIDPNKITFNRCLDMNDRALRDITINNNIPNNTRKEKFNITAASEIMAILALSKDINDLNEKLGNITIGYTYDSKPITAKDLQASEAMTILLKDAIKPNLVQTLEGTPAFIHCGPFANIAHGCNSILATRLALNYGDYVITEAGFGADLGLEKYLDIKARHSDLIPNAIVLVVTCKALRLHGGAIDNNKDISYLINGLNNLKKHLDTVLNVYHLPCLVCINNFNEDTPEDIKTIQDFCHQFNVKAITSKAWEKGGKGSLELAQEIINNDYSNHNFTYAYNLTDTIEEKIEKICTKVYGASKVFYTNEAQNSLQFIKNQNLDKLPICLAKTQYSLSDDPKLLNICQPFNITIQNIEIRTGSQMLVCIAGNMLLMPGLSKTPQATKMKIIDNKISGLM